MLALCGSDRDWPSVCLTGWVSVCEGFWVRVLSNTEASYPAVLLKMYMPASLTALIETWLAVPSTGWHNMVFLSQNALHLILFSGSYSSVLIGSAKVFMVQTFFSINAHTQPVCLVTPTSYR